MLDFFIASLLSSVAGPAEARKIPFKWARRLPKSCETTSTFYSSLHKPGTKPCCPAVIGLCAGGTACPASGTCGDGTACLAATPPTLPNVVLMISDDQGECHYGHAGECRSTQTGTPTEAPRTPNFDLLAGYGTVFPIAHNTAPSPQCGDRLHQAPEPDVRFEWGLRGHHPAGELLRGPVVARSGRASRRCAAEPVRSI
jgi:hypothetical protein